MNDSPKMRETRLAEQLGQGGQSALQGRSPVAAALVLQMPLKAQGLSLGKPRDERNPVPRLSLIHI